MVAVAVIGSSVVGAGATALSGSENASATTNAADENNQRLQDQYNQTRADLLPYNTAGQSASNQLTSMLPTLTSPISMTENDLQNTPGYQFNLTQGLKGVQNSAAARGLAGSGAALKGAATYATGLADSTYQNQFNNANTNQTNAYNRLMGIINTGENAGAQTGSLNNNVVAGQVANTTSATASNNSQNTAISNSIGSAANNIGGYYAYSGIYGGGSGGSGNNSAYNYLSNNALSGGSSYGG